MLLDARYLHLLHGARLAGDDAAPLEAAVARRLHGDDGPLRDEPAPPAHPGAGARPVAAPLPAAGLGQAGAVGHGVAVVGRVLQEGQLALLQRLLLLPTLPTLDRSPPQPVVSLARRPQHAIRPARPPLHLRHAVGSIVLDVDVISLPSPLRDPPGPRSRWHCWRGRGSRATRGLFGNVDPNFWRKIFWFNPRNFFGGISIRRREDSPRRL